MERSKPYEFGLQSATEVKLIMTHPLYQSEKCEKSPEKRAQRKRERPSQRDDKPDEHHLVKLVGQLIDNLQGNKQSRLVQGETHLLEGETSHPSSAPLDTLPSSSDSSHSTKSAETAETSSAVDEEHGSDASDASNDTHSSESDSEAKETGSPVADSTPEVKSSLLSTARVIENVDGSPAYLEKLSKKRKYGSVGSDTDADEEQRKKRRSFFYDAPNFDPKWGFLASPDVIDLSKKFQDRAAALSTATSHEGASTSRDLPPLKGILKQSKHNDEPKEQVSSELVPNDTQVALTETPKAEVVLTETKVALSRLSTPPTSPSKGGSAKSPLSKRTGFAKPAASLSYENIFSGPATPSKAKALSAGDGGPIVSTSKSPTRRFSPYSVSPPKVDKVLRRPRPGTLRRTETNVIEGFRGSSIHKRPKPGLFWDEEKESRKSENKEVKQEGKEQKRTEGIEKRKDDEEKEKEKEKQVEQLQIADNA
ncbi:hypothetical protein K474DRAFT_1673815 [Panus rudis PR-1116 ss-1]|nr:hypothetical protein K474DRAFT_1673815 [Panus rudis PR-1116 ss-1]